MNKIKYIIAIHVILTRVKINDMRDGSIAFRHNLCLIIYTCITMWLVKINE